MIKTNSSVTTVECGKEKATIAVTGGVTGTGAGRLRLQEITGDVEIGESPTPNEISDLPSVEILFHDVKSVDVYIRVLENIRAKMRNPLFTLAMAC